MRYILEGYFNENFLVIIMNITTNTIESLADVGTRDVFMILEGTLTTLAITVMIFIFIEY